MKNNEGDEIILIFTHKGRFTQTQDRYQHLIKLTVKKPD